MGKIVSLLAGGSLAIAVVAAVNAFGQGAAPDAAALRAAEPPPGAIWLEGLDLSKITQGFGHPQAGRSVDGNPLTLRDVVYPHGIGTHARGRMEINLKGAAMRFAAMAGVDDERKGSGSVMFLVWVDGRLRARTGVTVGGDPPTFLSVDLTGARHLSLIVEDGDDGIANDHADWAGALLTLVPGGMARPAAVAPPAAWPVAPPIPAEPPPPIASGASPHPAIHGPRVVGATPGRPFLFLIPATGRGPLVFSARHLPGRLRLDRQTGIISGALRRPGTTVVELQVRGPQGLARRHLTIIGGDHPLALTPPMGWNSWNVWGGYINEGRIRDAADELVRSGLAAHGYQYINIDAGWQDVDAPQDEIRPVRLFHNIPALAEYVHQKGLKLGLYTGPSQTFGQEQHYAETFARWGVDYLKLDGGLFRRRDRVRDGDKETRWIAFGDIKEEYRSVRVALDHASRDIVFSLSNFGSDQPWEWGARAGGNLWRTGGDLNDTWLAIIRNGFSQGGLERYAGPGHWNDPDMLVVGAVGWGDPPRPTRLTPNEQLTHITLWSLLAAPLLLGCDLSRLDPWTTALLTNDEVLDVDQDPLGRPAGRRSIDGWGEVWTRPLWDGTTAIGLFNLGWERATVTARWADLGLTGRQPVRDLWQQKNLGTFDGAFSAEVGAHDAVLVKIGRPKAARTVSFRQGQFGVR
jgi:alpha-galactosidase